MANILKVQSFPATKFFTNGFMDEFFTRGLGDVVGHDSPVSQPAVNVSETDEAFHIEIAAPGFDKPNFELKIENGLLVVHAQKTQQSEQTEEAKPESARFHRREFRFESFKRSFKLPNTVNQESISAVYEKGVLNISLHKKEDAKPVTKLIQVG